MVDESAQHAGHAGARETDSPSGETHFRVALVSPDFEGLPTIKRHRLVYQVRACVCRVGIRVRDWGTAALPRRAGLARLRGPAHHQAAPPGVPGARMRWQDRV